MPRKDPGELADWLPVHARLWAALSDPDGEPSLNPVLICFSVCFVIEPPFPSARVVNDLEK